MTNSLKWRNTVNTDQVQRVSSGGGSEGGIADAFIAHGYVVQDPGREWDGWVYAPTDGNNQPLDQGMYAEWRDDAPSVDDRQIIESLTLNAAGVPWRFQELEGRLFPSPAMFQDFPSLPWEYSQRVMPDIALHIVVPGYASPASTLQAVFSVESVSITNITKFNIEGDLTAADVISGLQALFVPVYDSTGILVPEALGAVIVYSGPTFNVHGGGEAVSIETKITVMDGSVSKELPYQYTINAGYY